MVEKMCLYADFPFSDNVTIWAFTWCTHTIQIFFKYFSIHLCCCCDYEFLLKYLHYKCINSITIKLINSTKRHITKTYQLQNALISLSLLVHLSIVICIFYWWVFKHFSSHTINFSFSLWQTTKLHFMQKDSKKSRFLIFNKYPVHI